MKPFLGIDVTKDKNNEQIGGNEFLTTRPSLALTQAYDQASAKAETTMEKAKLPKAIRIGQGICGVVGGAVALGILKGLRDVTVREAYANAPFLFWLAGICLVVWLILRFLGNQKQKAVLSQEDSTSTFTNLEGVCNAIYTELAVPADAVDVDVICFRYKVKGSSIKPAMKGMENTPYYNLCFKAFASTQNLYLANLQSKYAFPQASIKGIRTENKRIALLSWNKEQAISEGRYKSYKLTANQYGNVFCKPYHILEVEHNGEIWGIWFPSYELPIFEALTGHKAQ